VVHTALLLAVRARTLQVNAMPYADAVLQESMRVHQPAGVLFFQCNKDTVISDVTVPAGVDVLLCFSPTASPSYKEQCSHADKFWPEVCVLLKYIMLYCYKIALSETLRSCRLPVSYS
jgi:Cytochrome P450